MWIALLALMGLCPALSSAAPFQGDGKDYIVYVRGYLWLFARQANTKVTVTNVNNGNQVSGSPFTLATAGQLTRIRLAAGSNSNNHYRVVSDKPLTVATGELNINNANPGDAWATYVTANSGSRLGKTFHAWTNTTVIVYCHKSGSTTPSGRIADITDSSRPTSGTNNNDSVTLSASNALINNNDVMIWRFTNFDNDQITVTTATDCSVMTGHRIDNRDDWSVTPPSVDPTDRGRSYGKEFYTFVHRQMAIVPTQDNTTVTITDYSNTGTASKTQTFTLRAKQLYSSFNLSSRMFNGYTHVAGPKPGLFSDDFIKITSDKPVWVYSGPVDNDVAEHSVTAMPLPTGGGKQEAFCFVQNGVANDLQIMSAAPQQITITTMAGRGNHSQTINTNNWTPNTGTGPKHWSSGAFNRELIRLSSAQPIWVLCGDLDQTSWMSYLTSLPQNRPPVITVQGGTNKTVQATTNLSFNITGSDPDGDTLTWSFSGTPTGASITGTGNSRSFTWTPTRAQVGTLTLTINLRDNGAPNLTTTQTVTIVVTPGPNRPPVFTSTAPTAATEKQQLTYAAKATDPDGDPLTYQLKKGPNGASIDPTTGALTWTPGTADAGKTFDFEIEVCDNKGLCATQSFKVTVTNVNDPPKITTTAPTTATEDTAYSYKPSATDPDPNDTLTWKKVSGPAGVKVDPNTGEVTWTPGDADVTTGTHTIEIEVCDKAGACDKQSWTVTVTNVNDPPKITSTPPTAAEENKAYTYNATATDPDPNETLTWSLEKAPAGATIDPATGKITWTPNASDAQAGTRDFTVKVCDKAGACDTQSFTVTVKEANVPPVINSTPPTTAYVGEDINYQASATDKNAKDKLTWKIKSGPSNAKIDPQTGLVNWTPDPNDAGKQVTIEIEVCDDATPPSCVSQTITLDVRQKCRVDLNCKGQEICVQQGRFRVCLLPGCATQSPKCPGGNFCNDGSCKADICPSANCKDICHPVRGCIDTCATVTCQAGETCFDGKCKPSACTQTPCKADEVCDTSDTQNPQCIKDPCGLGTCKHGRVCEEGVCIDDPCLSGTMTCPQGQRCAAGQCRKPLSCRVDIDCPTDRVCEKGQCVEPGCYKATPNCNTGEVCTQTSCKTNPCDGKTCAADEFCRQSDGTCVKACPACKADEQCIKGACVSDPCANKSCPANQACVNGQCQPNRCGTPNSCKYGRICDPQQQACVDDPCQGVTCPKASQQCLRGECIDTTKPCNVDKDCQGTELCVNKTCVEAKCPATPCAQDELCEDGQCVKDPCRGKTCPQGQYCWAGQCADTCASLTCPSQEKCVRGSCVPDPCQGLTCPSGEVCDNGACVKECCAADSCKQGRTCRACRCQTDTCQGVTCPAGTKCDAADGQCKGDKACPNQTDAECPGDLVCVEGFCKPSDCYQNGCPSGKFCSKGQCVDNPCENTNCQEGTYCRATDGTCAPSCAKCPTGQRCNTSTGSCEADPCDGVTCQQGERCDNTGTCVKDQCAEPNNGLCKYQRSCEAEKCSDPKCAGITCPTGQTCRAGVCYRDQAPEEKITAEKNTEPITDGATEPTADGGTSIDVTIPENIAVTESTITSDQGNNERDPLVASGGCGCTSTGSPALPFGLLLLLLCALITRRRAA